MKIYTIDIDVSIVMLTNIYNWDTYFIQQDKGLLEGNKVLPEDFQKISWYMDIENSEGGEFLDFLGSDITLTRSSYNSQLLPFFENTGQVLKMNMSEEKNFPEVECWLYNPTSIIDCFDEKRSECEYYTSGNLGAINKYIFNEGKIPLGTSLFLMKERQKGPTLLVTGTEQPDNDFYFLYHKLGMTGLEFKELYRTPGEKDYDLEATIEKMRKGEDLETPIFKR